MPFKYPFQPNTESFVGMTNREIIERENAKELAETPSTEVDEKDEGGDPHLPNLPTTPEPGGRY